VEKRKNRRGNGEEEVKKRECRGEYGEEERRIQVEKEICEVEN